MITPMDAEEASGSIVTVSIQLTTLELLKLKQILKGKERGHKWLKRILIKEIKSFVKQYSIKDYPE